MSPVAYVRGVVANLKQAGMLATDGMYLVILSPEQAADLTDYLRSCLRIECLRPTRPSPFLREHAAIYGYEFVAELDGAFVVSKDWSKPPIKQQPPRQVGHLRVFQGGRRA